MLGAAISPSTPQLPVIFSNADEFNAYCKEIAHSIPKIQAGEQFERNRTKITAATDQQEDIIKTGWGGVAITKRNDPEVEKFLVVDAHKWLAFEQHAEKLETLTVHEGYGQLIYRPEDSQTLKALELTPGTSITLKPGQEHCLIAISNLLVFEQSMDYKGMDQDLIFIHLPVY